AWNVQAEPDIIEQINEAGDDGELVGIRTSTVEAIYLNFSDQDKEVDGQRSQKDTPHPFFSDKAVRDAVNLAIDRTLIAGEFYGEPDSATSNVLSGNDTFESPNTSWEFDLDKAEQTLEDAGWTLNDDVRAKNGV